MNNHLLYGLLFVILYVNPLLCLDTESFVFKTIKVDEKPVTICLTDLPNNQNPTILREDLLLMLVKESSGQKKSVSIDGVSIDGKTSPVLDVSEAYKITDTYERDMAKVRALAATGAIVSGLSVHCIHQPADAKEPLKIISALVISSLLVDLFYKPEQGFLSKGCKTIKTSVEYLLRELARLLNKR